MSVICLAEVEIKELLKMAKFHEKILISALGGIKK
jgi:hypothetical protein